MILIRRLSSSDTPSGRACDNATPLRACDCHEARETIDQRAPGLVVASCGPAQEAAEVDVFHVAIVTQPSLRGPSPYKPFHGESR